MLPSGCNARSICCSPVPISWSLSPFPASCTNLHAAIRSSSTTCSSAAPPTLLLQRGRQKRLLGGLLGFIGILHTCTRRLDYHPHIHYLIPAGSLSTNARKWMRLKKPDYLLPVQALSYSFRENIKAALTKKLLTDQVDPQIWNCDWVVHAKPAGSGLPVLKYLSRYVFRTALIATTASLSANNDAVTFAYKDSHTGRLKKP